MVYHSRCDESSTGKQNSTNTPAASDNEENWGYDLYPERKGGKYKPGFWKTAWFGEVESIDKIKCEKKIYYCIKNSPIVKLMMAALESSGCPVDIRRHISCEACDIKVSGGYDPMLNQIIVCQNVAKSEGMVQGVMAHEMIHMFDYCRNKLDFKNIDHLACTEIRAANLTHCSFMSAWVQGDASPFRVRQQHQECVKRKAVESVLAVRKVTREEAMAAVERVFGKCYNDLEPVGRRLRRNSNDMQKAYLEKDIYGMKSPVDLDSKMMEQSLQKNACQYDQCLTE